MKNTFVVVLGNRDELDKNGREQEIDRDRERERERQAQDMKFTKEKYQMFVLKQTFSGWERIK